MVRNLLAPHLSSTEELPSMIYPYFDELEIDVEGTTEGLGALESIYDG